MNILETITNPTALACARGLELHYRLGRYVIEREGVAIFYTPHNDLARDVFRGMLEEMNQQEKP